MRSQTLIAAGIAGCAIVGSHASPALADGPLPQAPTWVGSAALRALSLPPVAAPASAPEAGVASPRRLGVRVKRLDVATGHRVAVSGRVMPGTAGLSVALQIQRANGWKTIDAARTRASGAYSLADRRAASDSAPARVRVRRPHGAGALVRRLGRLNVYRPAYASWYGPGLYGNHLGCGGRLGAGTLGVAHKALPCGTRVTLRHGGRSVRVPVIDRGPYVAGREFDLTAATARRLGFTGHGPIGVARQG